MCYIISTKKRTVTDVLQTSLPKRQSGPKLLSTATMTERTRQNRAQYVAEDLHVPRHKQHCRTASNSRHSMKLTEMSQLAKLYAASHSTSDFKPQSNPAAVANWAAQQLAIDQPQHKEQPAPTHPYMQKCKLSVNTRPRVQRASQRGALHLLSQHNAVCSFKVQPPGPLVCTAAYQPKPWLSKQHLRLGATLFMR